MEKMDGEDEHQHTKIHCIRWTKIQLRNNQLKLKVIVVVLAQPASGGQASLLGLCSIASVPGRPKYASSRAL